MAQPKPTMISINSQRITAVSVACLCALASCDQKQRATSPEQTSEDDPAPAISAQPASELTTISADQPVSFNEHIQPILSSACYHCHGPDSGTREPGGPLTPNDGPPLRIDQPEFAFAKRPNGKAVIIPGDPDASLLLKLMESKNPDEVMPLHPDRSPHGSILAPEKIALVRRWIEEGAQYEEHWAYLPPKKTELPAIQHQDWARNPIDHFIAKRLEQAGLAPNDEEDKARLLRRLSFDLTGLPPSAEEVEQFTSDPRDFDTVYLEKVDQLLQSDAYAEHYARHWLDVARYADTHGIHIDNYRSIWPYRDWVIQAFRQNMPFDQFTREQIAGDMMPSATLDQKIASGFHRCLPTTGEGGAIAEEYQAIYAQDRADTTAAAWLGLTFGCASCHDHKFDAISTKENYQLTAFFRNTTMAAMDRNKADHPPNLLVPRADDRKRLPKLNEELAQVKQSLQQHRKAHESQFQAWLKSPQSERSSAVADEHRILQLDLNHKSHGLTDSKGKTYRSEQPLKWVKADFGQAVAFTKNNAIQLGNAGDFERDQAFSFSAWMKAPHGFSGAPIAKMHTQESHRGYDLWCEQGHLAVHLIHAWPQDFIKVTTVKTYPKNKWFHVTVSYDGSSQSDGVKIYINGKPAAVKVNANKLTGSIKTSAPLLLGKRFNRQPFANGQLQGFQLFNRELTQAQALAISVDGRIDALRRLAKKTPNQIQQLRDYYFESIDQQIRPTLAKLQQLEQEKSAIVKRGNITLVMQEKTNTVPYAHVLIRGEYANLGEKVSPDVPASLPPMSEDMPKNRLGLAQWLTMPENPLPARVTVNRYWSYLFGKGIVTTNSDFGVMGARPSHPKLLDWLAADFVENGWDFHHLLRTIVSSSTYRQSAKISAEKLARDPLNTLLSRGPRYRMDAEQIRDLALHSSGLMSAQLGGPSVKPPQPKGVWEAVAMNQSNTRFYKADQGNKVYRRSLYTFWKRTAVHPVMDILNAPSREVSCTQRDRTNTPLQALVVMNGPQFLESSRRLASAAMAHSEDSRSRMDYIAMRLLSRRMSTEESQIIRQTLDAARKKFTADPEAAATFIAIGATPNQPDSNAAELAAWTLVANQILNMDETLNK
ncbi:DUF1553 domain-containing protein [Verrucomicrobiaceae bacterium 5K15]|uniref:DUF1553 domain-containing protein n=1 Tax=Oceaniferula flava TaxID=2800421 RepID=A0AAE2SBX9_9BACT|nr:DUF1553 domain-containing protein [Oceaniferula flavus]MBK1854602.1 DUF1553 domain-containing protein [Oceaniferula flavus]MBM1135908.1 DUF1553 domain-containing protein [Oceaniferula flavus]